MLNRADLHSVLYDAVKDKVELRFGKTMSRVVPDETECRCDVLRWLDKSIRSGHRRGSV